MRTELAERILGMAPTGRAVLITDKTVRPLYAQPLADLLRDRGLNVALLDFPPGESHKNLDTVRRIYEHCNSESTGKHPSSVVAAESSAM